MNIPLVDLGAQYQTISSEIEQAIRRVLERRDFVLGEEVKLFEEEYARFTSIPYCIGVANGTDALELALRAIGVGPGDEVIVPANSFIASALAVLRTGARPALIDVDPVHLLMDADRLGSAVTPATKAIMPVHLFGQIAPMDAIGKVAADNGIPIVEDAAQAQGATQKGAAAGSFGIAAGTSFYPGKNLGAYGDAGAVLTESEEVAKRIRELRNWGSEVKYEHPEVGFNSRLDTLQAAILRVKLKHLAEWNEARRKAASVYSELLDGSGIALPSTAEGNQHIWHLYVVRVPGRDALIERLHAAGIGAGIHYPVPIHLQGAMKFLGYKAGDFPVTELAAKEMLSLPLYPEVSRPQQERVVEVLSN